MAERKWTPGPWFCEIMDNGYGYAVYGKKGGQISSVRSEGGAGINPSSGKAKATAHLIASAPELYEALEQFVYHYPRGINPLLDEAAGKARRAIAKSRGES